MKPSRGTGVHGLVGWHACLRPPECPVLMAGGSGGGRGGGEAHQRPPAPRELMEVTSRATLTFLFSPFHLFSSPFCFLFFPLSPFCSRDAAKRKAWKLNRVGSLRNIYSSSTNTEGNALRPPCLRAPARAPASPLPPPADMETRVPSCMLLTVFDASPWSFHLFVCVFYFTIHVSFQLT